MSECSYDNTENNATPISLRIALALAQQGYSVVPSDCDKKPLVKWAAFQTSRPTDDELRAWFTRWPWANLAIITGAVSGVFVVDADDPGAIAYLQSRDLPSTRAVITRRGLHFYFKHPGFKVRNIRPFPGYNIDVRGDGGMCTAPGSVHRSGHVYQVVNDLPIAPAPDWLLSLVRPVEYVRPVRRPTTAPANRVQAYGQAALAEECKAIRNAAASDANNQINRSAFAIGRLIGADAIVESEAISALHNAAIDRDHGHDLPSIRSGINAGKRDPRDLSHLDRPARVETTVSKIGTTIPAQEPAPADETANFCTHLPTIGVLLDLLSDIPKRALASLPMDGECSERTAARRRATAKNCTHEETIQVDAKSGRMAPADSRRLARLRVLFPQNDPASALIPALSSALLADALSDDEIEALGDLPALQNLTHSQRIAVRQRMRTLRRIERTHDELRDVPFRLDVAIRNVPDLRRELLRQIVEHYTIPDSESGELVCHLSNAVQACLLGVSIGALRTIRTNAGIQQTAPALVDQPIAPGSPKPSNTVSTYRLNGQLFARVQPVAEQRLVERPERTERPKPKANPATPAQKPGAPAQPTANPARPRRSAQQDYAAQLMRNLLHHLGIRASASEPLGTLANKIRDCIKMWHPVESQTELLHNESVPHEPPALPPLPDGVHYEGQHFAGDTARNIAWADRMIAECHVRHPEHGTLFF